MNARAIHRLQIASGLLSMAAPLDSVLLHINTLGGEDRASLQAAVDWVEEYEAHE